MQLSLLSLAFSEGSQMRQLDLPSFVLPQIIGFSVIYMNGMSRVSFSGTPTYSCNFNWHKT